jgi:hypothetical protein
MAKKIKKSDWPVGEKITILNPDSAFPEKCIKVASVYIPVACVSKGAKILKDKRKGFLAFAQYQADVMEKIAHNILRPGPNNPGLVADAKEVLRIVVSLRDTIDRGDIGKVCCDGIALGRFSERLRIRIHGFDGYIRQVKTTTRKLQTGFVDAGLGHSPEEITQAVRYWHKLHKADPKRKRGLIDKDVAVKFKVCDKTIRNWRSNNS